MFIDEEKNQSLIDQMTLEEKVSLLVNRTGDAIGAHNTAVGSLSTTSKIKDLLDNPASRAILAHHLPELIHAPELGLALEMPLDAIVPIVPQILTDEKLALINQELMGI